MTAGRTPHEVRDAARIILERPDLFPEEFISWLRRFVSDNSLIHISGAQGGGSSTGGGSSGSTMVANWAGILPATAGTGVTFRVPEVKGVSKSFTLTKLYARLETKGASATSYRIEKSVAGGVFTPVTVATITVAAGSYEQTTASVGGTLGTGDLIRILFLSIGTTGLFTVELEGNAS